MVNKKTMSDNLWLHFWSQLTRNSGKHSGHRLWDWLIWRRLFPGHKVLNWFCKPEKSMFCTKCAPRAVSPDVAEFTRLHCIYRCSTDIQNKVITSPQWWSGRSMATHIVLHLLSLIWGFGKRCRLSIASFHNQPMYPKMSSIDIFVNLLPTGWLKFE